MIRSAIKYFVNIYNKSFSEVIMTSEALDDIYDARQFVYWLAAQVSTPVPYQIDMYVYADGHSFIKSFPKSFHKPVECVHYPPHPFTRYNKRTRLKYREQNKQYYEYKDGTIVY